MAKTVFTDGFLLFNTVNLSAWSKTITLDQTADAVENTAMGQQTHTKQGGLKDWSVTLELQQDYAAAAVDATVQPNVGVTVPIEVRPTSAARSATNPGYTGTGLVTSYNPVAGSVGDLLMASVTIVAASNLVRNVA